MQTLSIDIETYSDVNLSKRGVYKYAESPVFEILLFGCSADGSDESKWRSHKESSLSCAGQVGSLQII